MCVSLKFLIYIAELLCHDLKYMSGAGKICRIKNLKRFVEVIAGLTYAATVWGGS
ncbi:MAG: hypothetical protein LBS28_04445 [Streptococcaceae bacterium]|jgi:hypothetical protein|nr:hypothetical protein [Streptococcaceae bacterium]